jgi:carbamoyl-phosphate synthase large subunit
MDESNKKKINILVTGVGAIIGYGIIKSLRQSKLPVNIVGMDIYSDAVGQYWSDTFVQAIYASDPQYISFLIQVMDQHHIDLVFFGTEQEIYKADLSREELGRYADKLVLNKSDILALSKDKWETREFLLKNDLDDMAIPSVIEGDYQSISAMYGREILLKPRSSYASKGIEKVSDAEKFNLVKERMGKNFMAQQLIGDIDNEYTVGVFGLGDGTFSGMIALRRKLSQEGATSKAEVVFDSFLTEAVVRLCKALKPIGPTNFQFRMHDGKYLLLEVNPRISASTSIRSAFGYNEAEMCVRYFLYQKVIVPQVKAGRACRYIDEVVTFDK